MLRNGRPLQIHYRAGDKVVYVQDQYSSHPGPLAKNVLATIKGELYQYQTEQYWIVQRVLPNGLLEVRTDEQQLRLVAASDAHLRPATLREKLFGWPPFGHSQRRAASDDA